MITFQEPGWILMTHWLRQETRSRTFTARWNICIWRNMSAVMGSIWKQTHDTSLSPGKSLRRATTANRRTRKARKHTRNTGMCSDAEDLLGIFHMYLKLNQIKFTVSVSLNNSNTHTHTHGSLLMEVLEISLLSPITYFWISQWVLEQNGVWVMMLLLDCHDFVWLQLLCCALISAHILK